MEIFGWIFFVMLFFIVFAVLAKMGALLMVSLTGFFMLWILVMWGE